MNAALESLAQRWLSWISSATWQLALLVCIVAAIAWAGQRLSPRFRYALWLLVLVKIFLPPSLAIGWGVGNWGVRPMWNTLEPTTQRYWEFRENSNVPSGAMVEQESAPAAIEIEERRSLASGLFVIWCLGCVAFLTFVLRHYRRLMAAVERMPVVEEGPLSIRLETIALRLGIQRVPELVLSDEAASPFLCGLFRPRIVLPRRMAEEFRVSDLDSVLLHELSHWRRRDPLIGWIQVLGQSLFWFHPLVWWANARLRHERECVCDEAVLQTGACEPVEYGEALLGVLCTARGRSRVQGSLVGVFEPGGDIQRRLEEIMNYESGKHDFSLLTRATVLALALLFLPMAIPAISADPETAEAKVDEPRKLPWVVETSPQVGAIEVDPGLREITITFDRDMGGGMSWTGGKESFFPPLQFDGEGDEKKAKQAYWRDKRTCVLRVELAAGEYYRVGINSTSHRNFKSSDGKAAPCSAIYFVTAGANKAIQSRVRVPQIVKLNPENGAKDVDPATKALRVTFDMPMGEGMSWTGGGENFPQLVEGQRAKWTGGGKSCVLPVELKPGWGYVLGLNSLHHVNFQSKWGVPAASVEYRFTTKE
ncbi:MAG: M56 family metallopeptidase [Planctomycetales bacterium]|nr:M56 family metallopeptidase [Planctomycetales bacterium]